MTRNNFLKSISILAGIVISNPLELFKNKEVMYHWTKGDTVSFIRNGDGAIYYDISEFVPIKSYEMEFVENDIILTSHFHFEDGDYTTLLPL